MAEHKFAKHHHSGPPGKRLTQRRLTAELHVQQLKLLNIGKMPRELWKRRRRLKDALHVRRQMLINTGEMLKELLSWR